MKFKNWLLLNEEETKNIVQGPILLYHGTSTGENNQTLNSFRNEGAKPIGGGHGQGRGLYVMSHKDGATTHAIKVTNKEIDSNVEHAGLPMIVSIEFPSIDTKEWDLDQEKHGGEIIAFIQKFIRLNNIQQIQKGIPKTDTAAFNTNLSPEDNAYLDKDTSADSYDSSHGMRNKNLVFKNKRGGQSMQIFNRGKVEPIAPATGNLPATGPFKIMAGPNDYESWSNVDAGAILSPAYLSHQTQNPEFHHAQEAKFIQNKIKNKKDLYIKYVGNQTFPVKSIEVFKDGQWTTV